MAFDCAIGRGSQSISGRAWIIAVISLLLCLGIEQPRAFATSGEQVQSLPTEWRPELRGASAQGSFFLQASDVSGVPWLLRIDGDGNLVSDLPLLALAEGRFDWDLAAQGHELVLGFVDRRQPEPVVGLQRLSWVGELLSSPLTLSDPRWPAGNPRLVWHPGFSEWGVAWEEKRLAEIILCFRRIDAHGFPKGETQEWPLAPSAAGRWKLTSTANRWWLKAIFPGANWAESPVLISGDSRGMWTTRKFGCGTGAVVDAALAPLGEEQFLVAFPKSQAAGNALEWVLWRSAAGDCQPVGWETMEGRLAGNLSMRGSSSGVDFAFTDVSARSSSLRIGQVGAAGDWKEGVLTDLPISRGAIESTLMLAEGDRRLVAWLERDSSGSQTLHYRLLGAQDPPISAESTRTSSTISTSASAPGKSLKPLLLTDGDGDGFEPPEDCDDNNPDVHPGALELCNSIDDNCDGTVDGLAGTRYVAPTGNDSGNACLDQALPCATIGHAIKAACAGETVRVAEGTYTEDLAIEKPIQIRSLGVTVLTQLKGTGTGDVLKILSGDVTWAGIEVGQTPGQVCIRIGDAAHQGLRNVQLSNFATHDCKIGVVVDGTGSGPSVPWNRMLGVDIRESRSDGTSDSGVGLLFVNGNGRWEVKSGVIRRNESSGMRVKPPAAGQENRTIVMAGLGIYENGSRTLADGRAGVEIENASDVRMEGNDIHHQTGANGDDDGQGVILRGVNGGTFYCNRVRSNDSGLFLENGTTGLTGQQSHFTGQTGAGIRVAAGAVSGVALNELTFQGNATAVANADAAALDVRHCWWGAASGPGGSAGGSGDPFTGPVDYSGFIPQGKKPLMVRKANDSGWNPSADSCFQKIQAGLDYASAGDLILVGPGNYAEHLQMTKVVGLEGVSGGSACSPTVLDGTQSPPANQPVLTISNLAGVSVRNLSIAKAGFGIPCGSTVGDQYGLNLVNVSDSTFQNLCLYSNGITDVRVYGASHRNEFRKIHIDGMTRAHDGVDICGHRSREGVLIDGGSTCEGGSGAVATGNRVLDSEIKFVSKGVSLKLAGETLLQGNTISASKAPAWDQGTYAVSVFVGLAQQTTIRNNVLGSSGQSEGIRIAGKPSSSCVTEMTDSRNTRVFENTIQNNGDAGIRIYRGTDDPGAPIAVEVSCNSINKNKHGVLVDYVGPDGGPDSFVIHNDITANTYGVRSLAAKVLNARRNWWGAASGPSGSGPGMGDPVQGAVDFSDWLKSSAKSDDDGDGLSECAGDCDDTNNGIHPGAMETCNQIDDNCDGSVDEGLPQNSFFRDSDGDLFGDPGTKISQCSTTAPPGYVADGTDCNDANSKVFPGASEICDQLDNDCDGTVDEDLPLNSFFPDADGDTFGASGPVLTSCSNVPPAGYSASNTDCNDSNAKINPAAAEICTDQIDNNCNGLSDGSDPACAGLEVPALTFRPGGHDDLEWSAAAGANQYAVVRGEIRGPRFEGYNHTCFAAQLAGLQVKDNEKPEPGRAFYYLVTGQVRDGITGEIQAGPLGQTSSGGWRPEAKELTCGPVVFVDPGATAPPDGLSWVSAYRTMGAALAHSQAPSRSLEIWVKGTVAGSASLAGGMRPGVRILGGFAGTESQASQRNPEVNPSTWTGESANTLFLLDKAAAEIDGMRLTTGRVGVRSTSTGQRLVVRRSRLSGFSSRAIDFNQEAAGTGLLSVIGNTFDSASSQTVKVVVKSGTLTGDITENTLAGGSDTGLFLQAKPAENAAQLGLVVSRNRIEGGLNGIMIKSDAVDAGGTAGNTPVVSANLIYGISGDGIVVESTGQFNNLLTATSAVAQPVLVGNTISHAGGAGISARASRGDTTGVPALHVVRSKPEIWDNLVTFCTGSGIQESSDDPALGLEADPLVIGNDLFGNGSLYKDEGGTILPDIDAVNRLTGARDNYSADPVYANASGRDYHIRSTSPARDRGHLEAPGLPALDFERGARVVDNDGDGIPRPDTGADELP